MANYRIELNHRQPYSLAVKYMIKAFCRDTGVIVKEANRRAFYESPRDEARRKEAEERVYDKRRAQYDRGN